MDKVLKFDLIVQIIKENIKWEKSKDMEYFFGLINQYTQDNFLTIILMDTEYMNKQTEQGMKETGKIIF